MYMSKQQPPTHNEYANWIVTVIQKQRNDPLYSTGFLAGYLASLMLEDPYVYKRFKNHIERVRNEPND
jgi:hypothetical protein